MVNVNDQGGVHMKYRAMALDLDGTLTDSQKRLPVANREAIWGAMARGCCCILASGRPVLGMAPLANELELDRRGGYVLAYNGGCIVDWKTREVIYQRILERSCIDDICSLSRSHGVYALTYNDECIVSENDTDKYMLLEARCNNVSIHKVDDLAAYVDYPVAKFLVVGEHERLVPLQEELLARHGGVLDAFFSESYFLEVVPAGVKKSSSLEILLGKLGIAREELIAFGDGMNDIPMLEYAGLGVVMGNAYDEVKGSGDFITKSNDEDGVAFAIEKFVL
jgi:hypothetical protein